jgi:hypothetical protein
MSVSGRGLYGDVYCRDRRVGREAKSLLAPIDPWLLTIAVVTWQGVVQGMTWDAVKVAVSFALEKLRGVNAVPTRSR